MSEFDLPQRSWGGVPVVAVSYCENALAELVGKPLFVGEVYEADHAAVLVPEPDNPFDPKAVSVRINGLLVGYLPKHDEHGFFDIASRITASALKPTVRAEVFIRQRQNYTNHETSIHGRISLKVLSGNLVNPLNIAPIENVTVLPWGDSKKVTGVAEYQKHLSQYTPGAKEGVVILTMHKETVALRNGNERSTIHLRLDGEPVGNLSPTTSAHYIPTIDYAAGRGVTLGVWARISGSALAAELNTQGAAASKIADEWLANLPTMPALVPLSLQYDVPAAFNGNSIPPLTEKEDYSLEIRSGSGYGGEYAEPETVWEYDAETDDMKDVTNDPEVRQNIAEQKRISELIVQQSNERIARAAGLNADETEPEMISAPEPTRTGFLAKLRKFFN